jgi:diphthine-ammonia ligase
MYQTVGQTGVARIAEAMCLPLYSRVIAGDSLNTGMSYAPSEGDEVEDLFELLKIVKNSCDVEGVGVGAVLSDYQRVRVESVCSRLNLTPLAYLWRRNQEEVLHTMIDVGIHAILIKVASIGLDPRKHLGKSLSEVKDDLERLVRP